jgi:hypothetical protein
MILKSRAGNVLVDHNFPSMSFSLRLLVPCLIGIVALTGAGCSKNSAVTPSSLSDAPPMTATSPLKDALEQAYEPTRQLTTQATPDAYFAALEPSILSEQTQSEMRQGWKFAAVLMKDMMPPLTSPAVKFYKVAQAGDWAGYYYAYKTADGITSFAVRRFRFSGTAWKVADFSMVELSPADYDAMPTALLESLIEQKSILRVTPPSQN